MKLLKIVVFISITLTTEQKGHVCSEDELIRELREDIQDNGQNIIIGRLDCLRKSVPVSGEVETQEMREARLAADWTSDCAFESRDANWGTPWRENLKINYGITTMIDANGVKYNNDIENVEDQADMCEIIRTLIGYNKFEKKSINDHTLKDMNYEFLDQINCYGDDGQTKVCAMTAGAFGEKQKWIVLLQPTAITFNNQPNFEILKEES